MPFLLILLLVGVLAYVYWQRQTTTLTKNCRWRADHTYDKDGKRFFHCVACGAITFCDPEAEPVDCLAKNNGSNT